MVNNFNIKLSYIKFDDVNPWVLGYSLSFNMSITSLVEEVAYQGSSLGEMMQKWQVASFCDLNSHGS